MTEKKVFVTVGTTKFDKLIEKASSEEVLDILHSLGYSSVQFQVGTGKIIETKHPKVSLKYKEYFENFGVEISKSDLVISHAGAGTCLEVLHSHKPLIVVINEDLMDNHQAELAMQLSKEEYLKYCTPEGLQSVLLEDFSKLKKYPKPDPLLFSNYLNKAMGFV